LPKSFPFNSISRNVGQDDWLGEIQEGHTVKKKGDNMKGKFLVYTAITIGLVFTVVHPEAKAASFFAGKTIRLIVGTSAGGGYDTYARAIARNITKHIPGNPSIIVQNMPGAGSIIAANYMYNVAKPNGLTMAMLISGIIMEQVMGVEEMKLDVSKFKYSSGLVLRL
jgi:tripartite-type tricarboxylate transporter receptor subunit TctC